MFIENKITREETVCVGTTFEDKLQYGKTVGKVVEYRPFEIICPNANCRLPEQICNKISWYGEFDLGNIHFLQNVDWPGETYNGRGF